MLLFFRLFIKHHDKSLVPHYNSNHSLGALSPSHFPMYINKLLVIIRTLESHIGSAYMATLSYAADVTLLCPSIRGLNEISVLCCEYAK